MEKENEIPSETPSAIETPSEAPIETPSEETPSETPTETPSETPSETPDENPSDAPSETPAEEPSETPAEVIPEEVAEALDIDTIEKEFYDNAGVLSDETMEGLYEKFPKDLVDRYFSNAHTAYESQISKARDTAFGLTEGEDNYMKMIAWVGKTQTPETIEAFNDSLNDSVAKASLSIKGMYSEYQKENKGEPNLLQGGQGNAVSGGGAYASRAEHLADVNDPRYDSDPAFRSEVATRLRHTTRNGGF